MTPGPAKRKTHFKSRKGCYQCKQRHTKCNEAHPRCSTCIRLDIKCTWPPIQPTNNSVQQPGPESHVSMVMEHRNFGSPDIISSSNPPILTIDDMRLMHHWTARTAHFYDRNYAYKPDVWQVEVVELAFEHHFLLYGILALAAIHKTIDKPGENRRALLAQADKHMSGALAIYKQHLQSPSLETALPTFILASILVTYNLASAQVEEPADPLSALIHCLRLLQGVRVVIRPHWEQLKKYPLFLKMAGGAMNPDLEVGPEDKAVDEVVALKELAAQLEAPDMETCTQAVEDLHNIYLKLNKLSGSSEGQYGSVFMIWPAMLTEEYMNLLSARHEVALIILVHFAVILTRASTAWWLQCWPSRIFNAALEQVNAKPELRKWLDWPASFIHPDP